MPPTASSDAGVAITRVDLSIGSLDLFRFTSYDHAFPRHSHDRFTLGVFGAGNGSIRVERGSFRAVEGSILAIAPDEAHAADPLAGQGWTYRTLYPSQRIVDLALETGVGLSPPFYQPVLHDAPLARRIEYVHTTLDAKGPSLRGWPKRYWANVTSPRNRDRRRGPGRAWAFERRDTSCRR